MKYFFGFIFLFCFNAVVAQNSITISGTVKDAKNGEVLIGAPVQLVEAKAVIATNTFGFYSLTVPEGTYTLRVSYIGYLPFEQQIQLKEDTRLAIELKESVQELKAVEIKAEKKGDNIRRVEMSVAKLDIKSIQKIPALLGEVDVVRSVQLLPGVTTVGEGATGFNVRGGSIDHNLILLDDAPVYNSAHLFGFFSIFNPDAVKDVKLLKGGIPAQFGGRLSSLLDVRMKDGNSKRPEFHGGIGPIFSRFSIEAPIVKEKASFILAGRRSYIDRFFPLVNDQNIKGATVYFYDFTAKANWIINEKNRLYLSGYIGRDKFKFGGAGGFGWNNGNQTATFRYNHLFSQRMFSNVSLIYSNYDYELGVGNEQSGFNWQAKIRTYSVKPEFTWYPNSRHTVTFGGQATYYTFDPGTLVFYSDGERRQLGDRNKYSLENALYVGDEYAVNGRLTVQAGLRFSNYNYLGPGTLYTYRDTVSEFTRDTLSSREFSNGKVMQTYNNLEPRLSLKFDVDDKSSFKASYNRMTQTVHLISNTTASTPFDVWTPSTNNIRPQLADQVAMGYFRNFGEEEDWEASVEGYYKWMQNQIDYVNGANLFLNKLLEGELIIGKGRAYGAEFYLKKAKGVFTGWVSYTIARTERQTNPLNNGNWYPSRFDRLHNLNVVTSYDINKRLCLSATFVLATGTPATFPTNRMVLQGYVIPQNANYTRNNTRIPAYHRLDVSLQYKFRDKFKGRYHHNLVISVYNVYNRRNPFSIYFQANRQNPLQTEAIQFSVIGSIVPSFTYNFNF
jgi:hypothetical protein